MTKLLSTVIVACSAIFIAEPVSAAGNAYFFGDSLTDCCHFGRTSNGPNWSDLLPAEIGENYTASVTSNYATGGAQSSGAVPADFLSQISRFTASGTTIGANDIAGIWIGSNDVWGSSYSYGQLYKGGTVVGPIGYTPSVSALTSYIVGNITSGISQLQADGFQKFVLLSTYDLGQSGLEPTAAAAALATSYSTALTTAERTLSFPGATTYFVDVQALLQRVQADPSAFGFSHVTGTDNCQAANCGAQPTSVQDTYVFNDVLHLTTAFDRLVASDAASVINPSVVVPVSNPVPVSPNGNPVSVPEPMSAALLLAGVAGLGLTRAGRRGA